MIRATGRFTFGTGSVTAAGRDDEIVVTARRPHPMPAKRPVTPVKGPFRRRASEVNIDGEVVDAPNKLIFGK